MNEQSLLRRSIVGSGLFTSLKDSDMGSAWGSGGGKYGKPQTCARVVELLEWQKWVEVAGVEMWQYHSIR